MAAKREQKRKPGRPPLLGKKLIKLSVQLHPAEYTKLQRIGEREDRSVAYLIRQAVESMLKRQK